MCNAVCDTPPPAGGSPRLGCDTVACCAVLVGVVTLTGVDPAAGAVPFECCCCCCSIRRPDASGRKTTSPRQDSTPSQMQSAPAASFKSSPVVQQQRNNSSRQEQLKTSPRQQFRRRRRRRLRLRLQHRLRQQHVPELDLLRGRSDGARLREPVEARAPRGRRGTAPPWLLRCRS